MESMNGNGKVLDKTLAEDVLLEGLLFTTAEKVFFLR